MIGYWVRSDDCFMSDSAMAVSSCRVARVEQTESPAMMEERVRQSKLSILLVTMCVCVCDW